MAIPDVVREWFASLNGPADPQENPEPLGEGEDPTTEGSGSENPEPTDEPDENTDPAPADAPDDTPADENTDTSGEGGDRTAPEPVSPLTDSERDAMNTLAAQNEALRAENNDLRTRIAELGGDAALGIVEEVVDLAAEEPADEYDPDADLAEQEAELARLRGE